jgi:hypothetical protein
MFLTVFGEKKQQEFGFSAFLELEMAFFIFFFPPLLGSCSCSCSCFWSCCVIILVCGWIYDKYGENG